MGEAEEETLAVFDVFVNHRGPDTKKNLASLIYRRLINAGLRVFLDQDELEPGDPAHNKIKSAIESSSVQIAIISVTYAESSWCLNELLEMLKSGRKVIPIFYGVKPADLENIMEGPYADAFRNHQNNGTHNVELVERWKDALKTASNISGIEFDTEKDDLGVLLEDIVEKVLQEAKWKQLHVDEQPVGLDQAAVHFNTFLEGNQSSGTTVVGIMGLHGSGKSILVTHLYNCYLKSGKFKRYCFLSELNQNKTAVLQQKLVRDLLCDHKHSISFTSEGKGNIQRSLKRRGPDLGPVLIVIDGLEKEEQRDNLLSVVAKDVLPKDSLILVTCHDKALLAGHEVSLFYQVKLLQGEDARELFCWHAFHATKPPQYLEDIVKELLEICCGLPLALKLLGRKLSREQDQRYWEEQLEDLRRQEFPNNIVDNILKVYLEEREKDVLLDVARFLVGQDRDFAERFLEESHAFCRTCLKELENKCLLELEPVEGRGIGSSKIRMHDLVRKMAERIASKGSCSSLPNEPLRLSSVNTSILQQSMSAEVGANM